MVWFCVWCALGTARGSGPEQHGGATTNNLKGKKCVLIALQLMAYVKVQSLSENLLNFVV